MSEIDERLDYIRERVDAHAWHNARADIPYLLDLVTQLRQRLDTHDAAASTACQEWSVECERLAREAVDLRERLVAAESTADKLRTMLVEDYGVMDKAGNVLDDAETRIQELEAQLVTVTALVPEAELLDSLSYCADDIVPVSAEKARALAARIRDWREGQEEKESDGN